MQESDYPFHIDAFYVKKRNQFEGFAEVHFEKEQVDSIPGKCRK